MLLDVLEFAFSSFWKFWGCALLLAIVTQGVYGIFGAILSAFARK